MSINSSGVPEECAAISTGCTFGPHGPNGEQQCRYCGSEPPKTDVELLLELAEADQELAAALAHQDSVKLNVDVAFATDIELAPTRTAHARVKAARQRRNLARQAIDLPAMRDRLLTPTLDLDKLFMQSIQQAVAESTWMPKEYIANDWQADVLEFLRNGPAAGSGIVTFLPDVSDRSHTISGAAAEGVK